MLLTEEVHDEGDRRRQTQAARTMQVRRLLCHCRVLGYNLYVIACLVHASYLYVLIVHASNLYVLFSRRLRLQHTSLVVLSRGGLCSEAASSNDLRSGHSSASNAGAPSSRVSSSAEKPLYGGGGVFGGGGSLEDAFVSSHVFFRCAPQHTLHCSAAMALL